jgi:hypothetical protein
MRWITVIGAGLVLAVGVAAAAAQGVGYPPGVNPSNPQDLTNRSNPQDLTVPGGNNPQDLSNRRPGVNVSPLRGPEVRSVPATPLSSGLRYTVKTKPKPKKKPHRDGGTAAGR